MSRSFIAAVSCLLLAVLSGAPAVAVVCAEWCADDREQTSGHTSHQGHARPSAEAVVDCHGASGGARMITALPEGDCADHGAAVTATAPAIGSRIDAPQLVASEWAVEATHHATTGGTRRTSGRTLAPPRPPAPSSPVLRI